MKKNDIVRGGEGGVKKMGGKVEDEKDVTIRKLREEIGGLKKALAAKDKKQNGGVRDIRNDTCCCKQMPEPYRKQSGAAAATAEEDRRRLELTVYGMAL